MSDSEIRRQLEKGDSFSLRRRRCTRKFINLPKRKRGNHYPAKCCLAFNWKAPKITRNLTTAWFAKRVDERRARCMKQ